MKDTERVGDIGRGRSRLKPDVGLDPRILGSRPEPKADAQSLSHPGIPKICCSEFPVYAIAVALWTIL